MCKALLQLVAKMGSDGEWLNKKERVVEAGFAEGDFIYGDSLMDGDLTTPVTKYGSIFVKMGLFTEEQMQEFVDAHNEWSRAPDRDIKVVCVNVLAFKR